MIVAVCPALSERSKLAIPTGMAPNTLHATVLYIEDNLVTGEIYDAIAQAMEKITQENDRFNFTAVELGRFEKVQRAWNERGGYIPQEPTDAVVLKLESAELRDIREQLIVEFKAAKIPYSTKFKDFKPHITLKYVPHGAEVKLPYELPLAFKVNGLELWVNDIHTFYPLKGE